MKVDWKQIALDGIQKTVANTLLVQDCDVIYDESLHKLNVVVAYSKYFTEEMIYEVRDKVLGIVSLEYITPWYGVINEENPEFVMIQLKFNLIQKLDNKEVKEE